MRGRTGRAEFGFIFHPVDALLKVGKAPHGIGIVRRIDGAVRLMTHAGLMMPFHQQTLAIAGIHDAFLQHADILAALVRQTLVFFPVSRKLGQAFLRLDLFRQSFSGHVLPVCPESEFGPSVPLGDRFLRFALETPFRAGAQKGETL